MRNNLKILFINPPYFRLVGQVYIYIPLGICSLASVTKEAGYETVVYNMDVPPMNSELFKKYQVKYRLHDERDLILMNLNHDPLNVWKELEEVLNDIQPDVVGISALTPQIPTAEKVADICKLNNPQTKIIIGGAHASLCPDELIKKKTIDYVFSGEAEEGILEFLIALQDGASSDRMKLVKGLCYKINGEVFLAKDRPLIDIEKYPVPSRELFVFPERLQPKNMGFILTGRGCPFRCKFCASPSLSGYRLRERSLEKIIDEIEYVVKIYNIDEFMFWEDTFISSKKKVLQFCNFLIERKINILWRCHTRLDTLNEDILDLMIASGCKQINVGVETGSEKILRYINKRISRDKIIEKMELLRSKGIAWSANFMIGYPEEMPEDIEETIEFIKTKVRYHVAINVCIPYPGTKFFEDCVTLGIIDDNKPIDWTLFLPKSKYACFSRYVKRDQLNNYMRRIKKIIAPYMPKTPGAFSPCERIENENSK